MADRSATLRQPRAVDEIECRARALQRNAEAALLDDLPVDAVLVATVGLAGWVATWAAALR